LRPLSLLQTTLPASKAPEPHRGVGVPIECAEINRLRRAARRAPYSKEPIARGHGGADRRREQHRHVPFLPGIPIRDQALGVVDDLPAERAARLRSLRCPGGPFAIHPALLKPMPGMVIQPPPEFNEPAKDCFRLGSYF
jgi:hypothetical protein